MYFTVQFTAQNGHYVLRLQEQQPQYYQGSIQSFHLHLINHDTHQIISNILHNLACKGGAISLMVQVNSLIREFHHAKLPYKQVTNTILFDPVFDHKSFKFDIFQRYILDTFLLRELKSVSPLQASKQKQFNYCQE
ncbi:Hypothetical_protein [Hexamita inflata]|uniref:Hypothetical_protein n=1 Tax=Hexamita inflata TaxID=28002 RepID=A0AA86N5H9_9EUKA|nr:Hypothetical protein HINF_LOCUS853 [Hexamita inflata]